MLRLLLLGTVLGSVVIPAVRAQSLSQVGDQAAKDVAENRKKAAAELDKGVRGQTDAKGVRGTGPEQGSPADIVAKMGVDPNSEQGKAYMTVLEAQRASLGNAAFDTRCMPKMVNNDSGMAQGEVFIQQYMAALSAGNAQGISDAVRRGQDNTAAMNHATASAKGPNCANTTTSNTGERRSKGAKIINVRGAAAPPRAKITAKAKAEADRLAEEMLRLERAAMLDPGNKQKKAAARQSRIDLHDFAVANGYTEDEYYARADQIAAIVAKEASREFGRLTVEVQSLMDDARRDPGNRAKQDAAANGITRLNQFGGDNGIPDDEFDRALEDVQKPPAETPERRQAVVQEYDRLFDEASQRQRDTIEGNNPDRDRAHREAEQKLAEFVRTHPDMIPLNHQDQKKRQAKAEYDRAVAEYHEETD